MYAANIVSMSGCSENPHKSNVQKLFQVITSRYLKKKKNPTDVFISLHLTENEHFPNDYQQFFLKKLLQNPVNASRQNQIRYRLL